MRRSTIGARRRRFVVELPLEAPDGFGGVFRHFVPGPQVWGAIEAISGRDRNVADRPQESVTHRVRLRRREELSAAMRLTLGLRRFAIRSASDPDGTGRETICLVEEIKG